LALICISPANIDGTGITVVAVGSVVTAVGVGTGAHTTDITDATIHIADIVIDTILVEIATERIIEIRIATGVRHRITCVRGARIAIMTIRDLFAAVVERAELWTCLPCVLTSLFNTTIDRTEFTIITIAINETIYTLRQVLKGCPTFHIANLTMLTIEFGVTTVSADHLRVTRTVNTRVATTAGQRQTRIEITTTGILTPYVLCTLR